MSFERAQFEFFYQIFEIFSTYFFNLKILQLTCKLNIKSDKFIMSRMKKGESDRPIQNWKKSEMEKMLAIFGQVMKSNNLSSLIKNLIN